MKQTKNSFSLNDPDNINNELDSTSNQAMAKYAELVIEYLKFIVDNVQTKNQKYSKFVIVRGLDTITNVFTSILYYTKDIEITYFHCQKSFYYYIEFISQISEAEKLFLQLSSRDASTYVYKKTLFDINNLSNIAPCSTETKMKFDQITDGVKLDKLILLKIINHKDFDNKHAINQFEEIATEINSFEKTTTNLIDVLFDKIQNTNDFLETVLLIVKNPETVNVLEKKIYHDDFESNLNSSNFVNWFFSPM